MSVYTSGRFFPTGVRNKVINSTDGSDGEGSFCCCRGVYDGSNIIALSLLKSCVEGYRYVGTHINDGSTRSPPVLSQVRTSSRMQRMQVEPASFVVAEGFLYENVRKFRPVDMKIGAGGCMSLWHERLNPLNIRL